MATESSTETHRSQHIALGERDLSFVPADPEGATTLRAEQVEGFNRDGFVSPVDVFSAEEAAQLRHYFDDLIESVVGADDRRNSYSVNCYHMVCERLYDLALDERVLDLVQDILGPDVVCWGTHLFAKLPGDGMEVPLHQDAVYWPFTSARSVTVWLAIDDVDEDNAAMSFVPGSHTLGPLPPRRAGAGRDPRPRPSGEPTGPLRRALLQRVASRAGLAPLRPAAARLAGQHLAAPPCRAHVAIRRRRPHRQPGLGVVAEAGGARQG